MKTENTVQRNVIVNVGGISLAGILTLPPKAGALILFAHGSGSSRFSSRNGFVAEVLNQGRLATLLFDLLSEYEEHRDQITQEYRFDIDLLADRLTGTVDWVRQQADARALPLGLFGSSTGAAAALMTAARRPDAIGAVVSRGGRPDLAQASLAQVVAPTLLIVGGHDSAVIRMNRDAKERMGPETHLEIIPGASHLFEEPGTLAEVARLTCQWFQQKLFPSVGASAARG